jgi:ABC-2 type transport system ATP-binding protein
MEAVIDCSDVKRIFTSRTLTGQKQVTVALNNLSFQVPERVVFGLLGPNGSGKTTTIRILSTLLIPNSGRATVAGFDVVKQASKVRKRIGLILGGERGLYGRLTGRENLRYFAALHHLDNMQARKRVEEVLELVGLATASDRHVEQYSRGMRQRLHVARGLLSDPEILFMDEPTLGLDPMGVQELHQIIRELVHRGKTILLTTHYMLEADELSDQIAIIDRGEIIASGKPSDVKRRFSKVSMVEVVLRHSVADAVENLTSIPEIERVTSSSDGPVQKLLIQIKPNTEVRQKVTEVLGEDSIDSIVARDPTLEETYLSIFKS